MKQNVNTLPRMPHSPEAETAFLGAILLGNPSTAEEMERLEWMAFFLPFDQVVFRHFKRLRECNKPTNDLVILQESLCATNELEAAGSMCKCEHIRVRMVRFSEDGKGECRTGLVDVAAVEVMFGERPLPYEPTGFFTIGQLDWLALDERLRSSFEWDEGDFGPFLVKAAVRPR